MNTYTEVRLISSVDNSIGWVGDENETVTQLMNRIFMDRDESEFFKSVKEAHVQGQLVYEVASIKKGDVVKVSEVKQVKFATTHTLKTLGYLRDQVRLSKKARELLKG